MEKLILGLHRKELSVNMVLVFILLFLIVLFVLVILLSTLRVSINKLEISNETPNTPLLKKFEMSIGVFILNKVKIFNKNINESDLKNAKNSKKMVQIKNKLLEGKSVKEKKKNVKMDIDILKSLNMNLKELNLELKLGTEDVLLTTFLIAIISIIISMALAKVIKKYDEKKYKYLIIPNYNNKNSLKISLNGIIEIKLVNIINILFKLLFRSDYIVKRTSNRRSYANGYE